VIVTIEEYGSLTIVSKIRFVRKYHKQ